MKIMKLRFLALAVVLTLASSICTPMSWRHRTCSPPSWNGVSAPPRPSSSPTALPTTVRYPSETA